MSYFNHPEPLTQEEIAARAPAAFAVAPAADLSSRYNLFPTSHVIDLMASAGFGVSQAMQKGRRPETTGVAKHLIRFRHEGLTVTKEGDFAEIVLTNSHDGTSSYQLQLGVFRLVCSNGLVVASHMFQSLRVRHTASALNVFEASMELSSYATKLSERIAVFTARILSREEQVSFATKALVQRYGEESQMFPVRPERLLVPIRTGDAAPTLWNTFNMVQERFAKGGTRDRSLSRFAIVDGERSVVRRTITPIVGIDSSLKMNQGLWQLADEFAQ